jgi:hypothetical protein
VKLADGWAYRRGRARVRGVAVGVLLAVVAASCATHDDADGTDAAGQGEEGIAPSGDELAQVDDVGRVYSGDVDGLDPDAVEVEAVEPDADAGTGLPSRPEGLLDVGPGLDITPSGGLDGQLEVRLELPPEPSDEAIPVVLHVLDNGTVQVEPGLWDPEANEVITFTNRFSRRFPGWMNPVEWAETIYDNARESTDFVVDFLTGRTDPPACLDDAPPWASATKREMSSVHVCLQDLDGTGERTVLVLKSNRNTAQLISLPTALGEPEIDDQPPWMRGALAWAARWPFPTDVEGRTSRVLTGGSTMRLTVEQPRVGLEYEIRSDQTLLIAIVNAILVGLGLADQDVIGAVVASYQCMSGFTNADPWALDVVPTQFENGDAFLRSALGCAFELLQEPERIIGLADEALLGAGAAADVRTDARRWLERNLERVAPLAKRLGKALNKAGLVIAGWDAFFDAIAEGRTVLHLTGTAPAPVTAEEVADLHRPFGDGLDRMLEPCRRFWEGASYEDFGYTADTNTLQMDAESITIADIDGDGIDDGLARFTCPSSTGIPPNGVLALLADGRKLVGNLSAELDAANEELRGDRRTLVRSMPIEVVPEGEPDAGSIVARVQAYGPDDPNAGGSAEARAVFALQDDALHLTEYTVVSEQPEEPSEFSLPDGFAGVWTGTLEQPGAVQSPYGVTLDLTTLTSEVPGTSTLPEFGCSGELLLGAVDDNSIIVTQHIVDGAACVPEVFITLTLVGPNELEYLIDEDGLDVSGTLTRE